MIGKRVKIVRVRPDLHRTYTTVGIVTDTLTDESNGLIKGVAISGTRDDGTPVHSWFAVGPDGLNGSLVTEQSCTVIACGHEIYGCRCADSASVPRLVCSVCGDDQPDTEATGTGVSVDAPCMAFDCPGVYRDAH